MLTRCHHSYWHGSTMSHSSKARCLGTLDATRDRGSERAELSTLLNMPPLDAKLHSEIAQWGLELVKCSAACHVLGSNDCVEGAKQHVERAALVASDGAENNVHW